MNDSNGSGGPKEKSFVCRQGVSSLPVTLTGTDKNEWNNDCTWHCSSGCCNTDINILEEGAPSCAYAPGLSWDPNGERFDDFPYGSRICSSHAVAG